MKKRRWLFSQSFEGAKSTAVILSLLETAKRHGLDAEKYMTYLLEHLPNEETLAKKEVLEAYLPWDKNIKRACKQKKVPDSTGLWSLFQYTLLLDAYITATENMIPKLILNKNQKQRYNSIMIKELTQTQVEELKQALKDKGTSKNFSKNL